ncbi:MAG: hypothetical protein II891_06930 [Bacteroidales bacterium]|nr:hypothetical protein [Bacteroidales bacterium]
MVRALGYKSVRSFASQLGINPQVFYDLASGKVKRLNPQISTRIKTMHPEVSVGWLITGEGSMFEGNSAQNNGSGLVINGNNNINSPIDNRHYYSDSPDVLRAQVEQMDNLLKEKEERIREKDAQIREKDAQIREKDAQIAKLLNILANK